MRAAICRSYGSPGVVKVEEFPSPPLADGQARLRVTAAAVNFPDVLLVANSYQITVPTPFIPGSEYAGVVTEVGDGIDTIAVGDRVTGTVLFGAFAEETVVNATTVTKIPDGVDDRDAAAFGVAYRTAYHALRTVACLRSGDELVVLGAGGGVGLAAVQFGAALGASVTAVASSAEKLDVAASYGARALINYRSADLRESLRATLPAGADVVVDPVGGDLCEPALRALRPGGRFVTVGYASGEIPRIPLNLLLVKDIQLHGLNMRTLAARSAEQFQRSEQELSDLLTTHRVLPHISAAFPLDEVASALRQVADGRAIGKVVLDLHAPERSGGC